MPPAPGSGLDLGRLSLRDRERGFLAGGTQTGKSTLADALRADFLRRYGRRRARCLILDTKPRYRAQWLPNGLPAGRRYKKWSHGAYVVDSVLIDNPQEMRDAFARGHSTVIVSSRQWHPKQDVICAAFLDDLSRKEPRLLQVDETCDHFHGNGQGKGSGALVDMARAGAERGGAALYCSQRTRGISAHLMEHLEKLYAFRLDAAGDAKRFAEFGAPPFNLPTRPHVFYYWTKRDYHTVWGPYRLELGQVA